MALDIHTELSEAQTEFALTQDAMRTAEDRLHLASIHLSNVAALLKPKPLPEIIVYVVDNGSYGPLLTTRLKGYIDVLAKSEFHRMAVFQNYLQMVKDKFPQVIIDAGLEVVFDTLWSVRRTTNDTQFSEYMKQAELFNPPQYRFDDVHNQPPEDIAAAVRFMRQFTDKPIIGTFGADDYRIRDGKREWFDMRAYVDAGLKISRQFFRQGEPVTVVDDWLKSGRIIDGVDLEAFKDGTITTLPQDFQTMLAKCLNAGIDMLTVYAPVNERSWLMWQKAPELWQAVNAGAVTVRLWKQ